MALILKYLELQEKYEEKFGERVIVLMQIGDFYEMYEYDPNNCATPERKISKHHPGKIYDKKIGRAVDAAAAIDAELTFQDSNRPYSIQNPNKAGFPLIAYERKRSILLNHNFVIVRIDQINGPYDPQDPKIIAPENGGKARKVAEIASPATELNAPPPPVGTNNILCIYVEYQKGSRSFEDFALTCGISSIDVTTGSSRVAEFYSRQGDNISAIQEILRFLLSQQPREVVINVENLPKEYIDLNSQYGPYAKFLIERLELNNYSQVTILCNKMDQEYLKLNYQRQFFQKTFFPPKFQSSKLKLRIVLDNNVFNRIGLEGMHYGRISYLLLLQYCYEHNENILKHVKFPDTSWLDSSKHLILTHNAAKQLHIAPHGGIYYSKRKKCESLFEVLNFTSTRIGHRLLHTRLFNPLTDPQELRLSYDLIEQMLPIVDDIELKLIGLPDLERYQHSLLLGEIKPKDLAILYRGYIKIVELYCEIHKLEHPIFKTLLFTGEVSQSFNNFLTYFNGFFECDKLECCRILEVDNKMLMDFIDFPVQEGNFQELDQLQKQLANNEKQLGLICRHLDQFLTKTGTQILDYRTHSKNKNKYKQELGGTMIMTTPTRAKKLASCSGQIDVNLCGRLEFITVHSQKMITSSVIENLCSNIESYKLKLRQELYVIYINFLKEVKQRYSFYDPLTKFVANIDFTKSGAKAVIKYNYYKPIIVEQESSFLDVQDLRHPIIERLIDKEYITNNVKLGNCENYPYGILMYGANSTGKSSLAQALALLIVMAQAGLWTAGKLTFRPYKQIITRLSGNDDITKGQSSFMIEMEEMRSILRNANEETLALGDEFCRGTETSSGTGLTVAALEELTKRRTSFIFSTHMHHLVETPYLKELGEKLQISHLGLTYDQSLEELVIDRKIQPGPGSTIYGIEVAKSMGLDMGFIQRAIKVRKEIIKSPQEILSTERNSYNSGLYKEPCLVCGSIEQVHTHHILPQKDADENGFIGHMHKDVKGNLVHLCQKCHQNVHKGGLMLKLCQTPTGQGITVSEA